MADTQGIGECVLASLQSRVGLNAEGEKSRTKAEHPKGWTPNGEGPPSHGGGYGDVGELKFREYQHDVFWDHTSGIVVLHWSRQIGKSFVLAAWAVWRLLSRPGRLVTVLSNSKENGAEFLLKCAEVCRLHGTRFETVVKTPGLDFEDMRMELRIRNQGKTGRIKVLAANPRTARGFSGDLILDEFAFHEDGNKIWEAAEPILASNKDFLCRIASTGNGKRNLFYRMVEGGSCSTTDSHGPPTSECRGRLTRLREGNDEFLMTNDERNPNGQCPKQNSGNAEAELPLPVWMRVPKAGDLVDGVTYVPGAPQAEQVQGLKFTPTSDVGVRVQSPKLENKEQGLDEIKGLLSPTLSSLKQEARETFSDGRAGVETSQSAGLSHTAAPGDGRTPGEGEESRTNAMAEAPYYFVSRGGFKVSRVTRTMAHSMGVEIYDSQTREPITPEQARAQALDKAAYDQNYECSFADESLALLTHELISAAECDEDGVAEICEQNWTLDALELMRQAKSPLYAGLDVGRKVDLSVITVLERVGTIFWVRGLLRMKDMRLPDQEERLQQLRQCRQVRQICIDMTGLGLGLFEYAQRTMGEHMISGINFSSSVSATHVIREEGRNREKVRVTEAMAMELLRVYEDRRIRQPRDWQLREDLRRPGKVTSPAGRVSIAATRDGAGHADHFWSLALALEAAGGERVPWAWQAIKLRTKYGDCGL